jgi:CRISPR/Cas system CSM-associated protein Csm3 (group 7 of RAMP superfamily)
MELVSAKKAVKFSIDLVFSTPVMIRSGETGDFSDSTVEKTRDGRYFHINGYVWSSLMRRALSRIQGTDEMVLSIGDYPDENLGISPFWSEASLVELKPTDIRPGVKIDRKWGAAVTGALYTEEIVIPGYKVTWHFNYFCDDPAGVTGPIQEALWVIDQGIETIGGGWSYGYGRLAVRNIRYKTLDLTQPKDRKILWHDEIKSWDVDRQFEACRIEVPHIRKPWKKIKVSAAIADGQLFSIGSPLPPDDVTLFSGGKLPDRFVFRRFCIDTQEKRTQEIAIPGKAIRQALFSVPIERRLRSENVNICENPDEMCTCQTCQAHRTHGQSTGRRERSPHCDCRRCQWFGSVDSRGLISVADAVVKDVQTQELSRIQLCEHSMQNMNLFSQEFLTAGRFDFDILIDRPDDPQAEELLRYVRDILEDMTENAPPGWYRLGANTTCAGQIQIRSYNFDNPSASPAEQVQEESQI